MPRQHVTTGTRWEEQNAYSRAVRTGNLIFVAGTLAADEHGNIRHPDHHFAQATYALEKIERALKELGADRRHIVRTRWYVTRIEEQAEYGRAHAAFFGDIRPAMTMVEIKHLASPLASVEIEADAVVDD